MSEFVSPLLDGKAAAAAERLSFYPIQLLFCEILDFADFCIQF